MSTFKPVRGDALKDFDSETIELYSRRHNDPRLSYILSTVPRRERNNLPVIVDTDNNSLVQDKEAGHKSF